MAKGYVIVNANVTDPEKYAEYRPLAAAAIEAFGGRYLARGGKSETLEGSLLPRGVVIDSMTTTPPSSGTTQPGTKRRATCVRARPTCT